MGLREITIYTISAFLLIASAIILFHSTSKKQEKPESTLNQSSFTYPLTVDLSAFEEHFFTATDTSSTKIQSLIVLSTQACYICLNNVAEFSELIQQEPLLAEPIILFIDEDEDKVKRFMHVTEIQLPYLVLPAHKMDPVFYRENQNLMFIDKSSHQLFFNTPIPNAITTPEYKTKLLAEAVQIWKEKLNRDQL